MFRPRSKFNRRHKDVAIEVHLSKVVTLWNLYSAARRAIRQLGHFVIHTSINHQLNIS